MVGIAVLSCFTGRIDMGRCSKGVVEPEYKDCCVPAKTGAENALFTKENAALQNRERTTCQKSVILVGVR
jgi:hypothetical protein